MKRLFSLLLLLSSFYVKAQLSSGLVYFDKLIDIKGTPNLLGYVINSTTLGDVNTMNLLYINTETGKVKWVDLPDGTLLIDFKQIKIDSQGINQVAVLARIHDTDKNGRINLKDPISLLMVSTDGSKETFLTQNNFFVRIFEVNEQTGILVVTGYYDTNLNGRHDNNELNEVQMYDLKTLKLLYQY